MLSLDDRNVRISMSDIFKLYPDIYGPALDDIRSICKQQLGVAYMRDFRTRAKKSRYFVNALVEPQEPTSSMISHPRAPPPSPNPSFVLESLRTPSRSTSHRMPAPTSPDDTAFTQLTSRMSLASISEDSPRTPSPMSHLPRTQLQRCFPSAGTSPTRQHGTPSPTKKRELPLLVLQLLGSLSEGQARVSEVLWVYNHVGRQGQEEALVDVGVNRAVAMALTFLLD
jgi:hypothetical protein